MRYQSIVRLFEYCNIEGGELNKAKTKQILVAEFAIAKSGIISVDGFDYSKNDVFAELDNPDFGKRLVFHQIIWNNKSFLNCIEQSMFEIKYLKKWRPLSGDKEFLSFISPYFAVAFDKIMKQLLDKPDFRKANKFAECLCFVGNPEDAETALNGIRLFIEDFTRKLKNVNEITYKEILPELKNWTKQPSIHFVNNFVVPLYDIVNDLVTAMMNFRAKIQHANPKLCDKLTNKLMTFKGINPELRQIIHAPQQIINTLILLLVIFVVVMTIIGISTYNNGKRL